MFAIEKFRRIERKRVLAAVSLAPANDNHCIGRYAQAVRGRTALVGHWRQNAQTGRLEWNWRLEVICDAPEVVRAEAGDGRTTFGPGAINNTSTGPDHRDLGPSRKSK
jgi:hypothetical protein